MVTRYLHTAARLVITRLLPSYAKFVLCAVAKLIILAHVDDYCLFRLLPQAKSQLLGLRPGQRLTHTRLMVGGSTYFHHVHIIT